VNHNPKGPTAYANAVVAYSAALKAVDPSIKVGVVVTAPGNWPDGQVSDLSPAPWNDTVLGIAAKAIDFVDVHWYPQGPTGESDAALLASPQGGESTPVSYTPSIASVVSTLRSQIAKYRGGTANDVEILAMAKLRALFLGLACLTAFTTGCGPGAGTYCQSGPKYGTQCYSQMDLQPPGSPPPPPGDRGRH
jgi:hypothetical protein